MGSTGVSGQGFSGLRTDTSKSLKSISIVASSSSDGTCAPAAAPLPPPTLALPPPPPPALLMPPLVPERRPAKVREGHRRPEKVRAGMRGTSAAAAAAAAAAVFNRDHELRLNLCSSPREFADLRVRTQQRSAG